MAGPEGLQELKAFDLKAKAINSSHPLAASNFRLDGVGWRAAIGKKGAVPRLHLTRDGQGTLHLTPWATVVSSSIGMKGTMGMRDSNGSGIGPSDAVQTLTLSNEPLVPKDPPNDAFTEYGQWLGSIESSLLDHLAHNINLYPPLHDTFKTYHTSAQSRLLRCIMSEHMCRSTCRQAYSQAGTGMTVTVANRLYVPPHAGIDLHTHEYACRQDEEVGRTHGLVRMDVPIYSQGGTPLPLEERVLAPGTIVSVMAKIVGFAIKVNRPTLPFSFGLVSMPQAVFILRPPLYATTREPVPSKLLRHFW